MNDSLRSRPERTEVKDGGDRVSPASIVFGVFKGMGDLLSAAPVLLEELKRPRSVHLLLFPNPVLHEFCGLVNFCPYQSNLHLHAVPQGSDLRAWRRFVGEMRGLDPEMIWISPHAPAADSSWKIPLMLRLIRGVFWGKAEMIGADTERLSWLFDRTLAIDRSLPLRQREWSGYRLLRGPWLPEEAPRVGFLPEIAALRKAPARYDLVIHPGANAKNRTWPFEKYAPLLAALPTEWCIAFLGLPTDMALLKPTLPPGRPVAYVTGRIRDSIETLASARMLLIMDSGNMHFAQVMDIPSVAVFGYTDPSSIIDLGGPIDAVYEPRFPCQPCRKSVCSQPEIYCLNAVEPEGVAQRLRTLWATLRRPATVSSDLVQLTSVRECP